MAVSMNGKRHALWIASFVLSVGCSSGGSNGEQDTMPPDPNMNPPAQAERLLEHFSGCPSELFESLTLVDDFDSQTTLDTGWQWQNDGRFPRPRLDGGALVFGPHNLDPAQWWNNWTPVRSLMNFGDI